MKKITHNQQEDKQENIILDDDITISKGKDEGRKLSEVLHEQTTQINKLSSNVKWLYKYGGVGSGSGGGGGTGGSWSVQVIRTDTKEPLLNGKTVNFGKEGTYGFAVQIYNGGTSTFKVTYNCRNSKGTIIRNDIVWSQQNFLSTQSFLLDMNGQLSITILNQDTQIAESYIIPYVINAYIFTVEYVEGDTLKPKTFNNNTIFMADVREHGLKVLFTSNVSVGVTSSSYTYVDWMGKPHTISMDDPEKSIKGKANKKIYLDLVSDEDGGIQAYLDDDSNAGFKQFLLDIDLLLEGNTIPENIQQLSLKDNLIPSTTYLKVTAFGGTIYDTEQSQYPENGQFNLGAISFNVTPYDGAYNANRTYTLHVYDSTKVNGEWSEWGEPLNISITTLYDQTEQTIAARIGTTGEHRIKFSIISSTSAGTYDGIYYFCVKEVSSNFNWYEQQKLNYIGKQSYYRSNVDVYHVSGISKTDLVEMTPNSTQKEFQFTSGQSQSLNDYDQFISIGLQYSEINDLSSPIACITSYENDENIYVFQNKISIGSSADSGESVEIYFPLTKELSEVNTLNYHLLSIYKRYETYMSGSYYKTISIYLDGVFEGVFKQTTAQHRDYRNIVFYKGNYICNLFEYSTFFHNSTIDEQYYNSTLQTESIPFLTDNDIVYYYYTYKQIEVDPSSLINETEQALFEYFKSFREDEENFIHTDPTTIENIAIKSPIPVMVINSVDRVGRVGNIPSTTSTAFGVDNFKIWMSQPFEENDIIDNVDVTIQWKGQNESNLNFITKKNSTEAAIFSLTLQGSSTLTYRCKNFELMAPLASEGYSCIYSPNFDSNDNSTFLPESSFTLKADVVDSSHTNNNAMGLFVNTITTPFERAQQNDKPYSNYIKNCLTGKAFLLFLHTSYKSTRDVPDVDENQYYFLGIYNLNLGRKSYYNLGYKDLNNLTTISGGLENGFKIYEIADSNNTLLNGVVIGEIQGNNPFFDFSQSHETILYQQGDADKQYMFGDIVDGAGSSLVNAKNKIKQLVKKISLAGGWVFQTAGKEFNEDSTTSSLTPYPYGYTLGYSETDFEGTPTGRIPNYLHAATRNIQGTDTSYTWTDVESADRDDFLDLLIDNPEHLTTKMLDYTSLCEYYTTCMAFGLVDSVQKNLNIKSWNAGGTSNDPLFYIAFYDMDTCLGVSNSGTHIDYFAFSDYWLSKIEGNNLNSVVVYRDFSPKNTGNAEQYGSFFDTPSSYLFAIAKYGFFVKNNLNTTNRDELYYHPSNLWAIWRRKNKSQSPGTQIEKQTGCLANAERFMSDYYIKHLEGVPYSAFNYNYRYKYFVKINNGRQFDTTNFEKFHGRKISYTQNWLEGRFHLLDAYFNLNSISDVMVEGRVYAPFADSSLVDSTNEDIYVLKDVFSNSPNGNQYSNLNVNIEVSAKPFAPLILDGANSSSRYLFPEDENRYRILLKTDSNQTLLFGGSSLWTYVSTINPFITAGGSLMVNSKYFTNLFGNNNAACSVWDIDTPSLKTISLTGQNYSGELAFVSSGATVDYPNLTSVTINGTRIRLKLNHGYIETINAFNMREGSMIDVANITTLKPGQVNITGNVSSITIPAWQQDIYFPTDYPTNNQSILNCSKITITNDISKYPHNRLYIYNNETLASLTFSGFSEVYIEQCPNLSSITISDSEANAYPLTKLTVIMPDSSTQTQFSVNDDTGIVDLSGQSNLTNIQFKNCKMNTVILPPINGMILGREAFRGCSELTYLRGTGGCEYYINSGSSDAYTFADCEKFTLRQSSDENSSLSPIYISSSARNLSYLFAITDRTKRGSITLDTASEFLQNHCNNAGNVTDISYMFYNQNIEYLKAQLLSEYLNETCSLSLGCFKNATNASRTFLGNKISGYNRYMFKDFGLNTNSIIINYIIGEFSERDDSSERWEAISSYRFHILYATIDFLYEILDRVAGLAFFGYNITNSYLRFINNSGSPIIDSIYIGEGVFRKVDNGAYVYPRRLVSLSQFEVFPSHTISLRNMFYFSNNQGQQDGWIDAGVNGLSLTSFFYYGGSYYTNVYDFENLLSCVKITSVVTTLRISDNGQRVNMANFLNWNGISQATNLFYSIYESLSFSKYIDYSAFQSAWENILTANQLTGVGYLFQKCLIIVADTPSPFKLTEENFVNETIVNTYCLFNNCKLANSVSSQSYVPMKIYHSFLDCLPNLINVQYMFQNTYWYNTIPFDFFHKRKETSESVYAGNNPRIRATLYKYSYTKDMIDMSGCFRNIMFSNGDECFKHDGEYNENQFKECRVVDTNGVTYDTYYRSQDIDAQEYEVEQNTEIADALKSEQVSMTEYVNSVYNDRFTNFSAYFVDNKSGCFVTPDLYYGMSESGSNRDITYSLGVDTATTGHVWVNSSDSYRMSGLVPEHLLKNIKSLSPKGILSNLNLLPWYIGTYEDLDSSGNTVDYKCYCYIPSNFTENSSLSETFNFHLILPNTNSIYYVLHNNSIPANVTSLSNSLPGSTNDNVKSGLIGQLAGFPNTAKIDYGIRYNVMFDEVYEQNADEWEYQVVTPLPEDAPNYSLVSSLDDPVRSDSPSKVYIVTDGTNVYYDKIPNHYSDVFSPNPGIDMNRFNILKLDNLINMPLSYFLSGRLFKEGTLVTSMWKSKTYLQDSTNNYVVRIGYNTSSSNGNGLSKMSMLPLATKNDHFIYTTGNTTTTVYINTSSIEEYDSSAQYDGYPNITFYP